MLLDIGFFQPFPLECLKFHPIDFAWMEYGRLYHSNLDGNGQELCTIDLMNSVVKNLKDVLLFPDSSLP